MKRNVLVLVVIVAAIICLPLLAARAQDSDSDGMPDSYENTFGCQMANTVDSDMDYDSDGLMSLTEYQYSPNLNPCVADTDGDGVGDGIEISAGANPVSNTITPTSVPLTPESRITVTPASFPTLAWTGTEFGMAWQDGSSEVYFGRFGGDGDTVGSNLRVTYNPQDSWAPWMAWAGTRYGVVWEEFQDSNYEVYFASFSASGTQIGGNVRITSDLNSSRYPFLIWTGSEYGVTWADNRDGNYEIYFARISQGASKIGSDTRISNSSGSSTAPSLAWSGTEYGLSWSDNTVGNGEIYFCRLDYSGSKVGGDVRVTNDISTSGTPFVAYANNQYGIAWNESRDGNEEIYFTRLSTTGTKIGSDLRISQGANYSRFPALTWSGGDFGLAWQDFRDSNWETYFAWLAPDGNFLAGEQRITFDSNPTNYPAVAWSESEYGVLYQDQRNGATELYFTRISVDPDGDGLDATAETTAGTYPNDWDTDNDRMDDGWEVTYSSCLSPLTGDSMGNPDSDAFTNIVEYGNSTDPCNYDAESDRDGDGLPDSWEDSYPCMMGNTVDYTADYDFDTLENETEYYSNTNPCSSDSDGDSLSDPDELYLYGTNPANADSDYDFMPDDWEVAYSTCVYPTFGDSLDNPDSDSFPNLAEYGNSTDPCVYDGLTPNTAPVLTNLPGTESGHWGQFDMFFANAMDYDIPSQSISWSGSNNTCSFAPMVMSGGIIEWTCEAALETCSIDITATDDGSPPLDDTETLTIECGNTAPDITSTPAPGASVGVLYSYTVMCSSGDGDSLFLHLDVTDTCGGFVSYYGAGMGMYEFVPSAPQGGNTCVVGIVCSDTVEADVQSSPVYVAGCEDNDGDGYGDLCGPGPDCDDNNQNAWDTCATCVDWDTDTYYFLCNQYVTVSGPDCDDYDQNNWMNCVMCRDMDFDTYYDGCDAYITIPGPDCDDYDQNNWASCASCQDGDTDFWFAGCDAYITLTGPDCNDANQNAWDTCATCADNDTDTYYGTCNQYAGINGPDLDDANVNCWDLCMDCVDYDGDSYYFFCDQYLTVNGPDCDDYNTFTWDTCATCVDGDTDTWYETCNRYEDNPVTVGNGTENWWQVFYTVYDDVRTQVIYLAPELGQAGTITAVALDVRTTPGQIMNNFTIRMKHTALSSYGSYSWEGSGSGWTTVYQDNAAPGATGWRTFTLTTPFVYDGASNLMVDFSFNNTSHSTSGFVNATNSGATRSMVYFTDSLYGDPLEWTGTSNPSPFPAVYIPNTRFTFSAINGPDCNDSDRNNWASCASCLDGDTDTWFAGCDAYVTIAGPDCGDSDPNNWINCSSCIDGDTDAWFTGCDTYDTISGPDCNDGNSLHWQDCGMCMDYDFDGYGIDCDLGSDCDDMFDTGPLCHDGCTTFYGDFDNDSYGTMTMSVSRCAAPAGYVTNSGDCYDYDQNTWDTCATCNDGDADTYYELCNQYISINGPDCNDSDLNNWTNCASCQDGDTDIWFDGCDAYVTIWGPDCNDLNQNAWNNCGTCVDNDSDTWFELCDQYQGINGPDCNDSDQNNWTSCASCMDGDTDSHFYNCDAYVTIAGPDCNDFNHNTWDTCATCWDGDGDYYFELCNQYLAIAGPDCNDSDQNNWNSCASCQDGDTDTWFDGCDAYTTIAGPDCDDLNQNAWNTCPTCNDDDTDTWFEACNEYNGINGPDLDDANINCWDMCMDCVDGDTDSYYFLCNQYVTVSGPDCNDSDPNNWTACAACVDGDFDTWYVDCDAYVTIDGPDCNDGNSLVNGGLPEILCDTFDNDCNAGTPDDKDDDLDTITYCQEIIYGTTDSSTDSDADLMPDAWEIQDGLSCGMMPAYGDSMSDQDGDGLLNLGEYGNTTDPCDPDTDGDTLSDGDEVNTWLTDPLDPNTDGDAWDDGDEVNIYGTDPTVPDSDTDSDGLPDAVETDTGTYVDLSDTGTDPNDADSDDDGANDGDEANQGSHPLDDRITPSSGLISTDQRLTFAASNSMNASLTWTGSEFGLAWRDDRTGAETYFARLSPLMAKIGDDTRVTSNMFMSDYPSIAWNGSAYGVAWQDQRDAQDEIYFSMIGADGTTSGIDTRISYGPSYSRGQSLVRAGSEFGLSWSDNRDGNNEIYFTQLSAGGTAIGGERRITFESASSGTNTALAWSGSEFGMVWPDSRNGNSEIYFRRLALDGSTLGPDARLSFNGFASDKPVIAWTGSEFGVVWDDGRTIVNDLFFIRVSPAGSQIGPEIQLGPLPDHQLSPSLAWTGSEFGVTWYDNSAGNTEIFFSRFDAGGANLSPEIRLSHHNSTSMNPALAWSGSHFGIVWHDVRDGNNEIYYALYAYDSDGDGIHDVQEPLYSTNPNDWDSDDDLMPDGWEVVSGSSCGIDPNTADGTEDDDGDELNNLGEYNLGSNPCDPDSDDDGMEDGWEAAHPCLLLAEDDSLIDGDTDGLTNLDEYTLTSNPCNKDTDGDGMGDGWENQQLCLSLLTGDSLVDGDTDTLSNLTEFNLWSNPCYNDSDYDGMDDGWEYDNSCLDLITGDSVIDGDTDGLANLAEYILTSNPCNPDTDADGMDDDWEVTYACAGISPLVGDSLADGDTDGLGALAEYGLGINPCNADTDGDGLPDGWEAQYSGCGLDPAVASAGFAKIGDDVRVSVAVDSTEISSLAWTGSELGVAWVGHIGEDIELYFTRLSSAGEKLGADLRLTSDMYANNDPSLAWTGSEFGVSWTDSRDGGEIYFARISAAGTKIGTDLPVTSAEYLSHESSLAWTGSEFGVSWTDMRNLMEDVYFARLAADGSTLGSELRITADGGGRTPSLAWANSEFGVSWFDYRDGNWEIYFSRVSAAGSEIGDDLRVTSAPLDSELPSLAWTGSQYGLAWLDWREADPAIYFVRLSPAGTMMGGELRLTDPLNWGERPDLAWTGSEFMVSWDDYRDSNSEIYLARVSSAGAKIGDDFRVTSSITESEAPDLVWTGSAAAITFEDNLEDNYQIYLAQAGPGVVDHDGDGLSDTDEYVEGTDPCDPDSDDDTLSDGDEVNTHGTNPLNADTDGDGLPDPWEIQWGTNPLVPDASSDPDFDGLVNLLEYQRGTDPHDYDTDNDGLSDGYEHHLVLTDPTDPDSDDDGASDGREVFVLLTLPLDPDTDNDGMTDGWEGDWPCVNELVPDDAGDPDGDLIPNLNEFLQLTNPCSDDTDGDGMTDVYESAHGCLDAFTPDASGDPDTDTLTSIAEMNAGTDPCDDDSDDDGLGDGAEVNVHYTNPLSTDSDDDGLSDGDEVNVELTNPLDPDSDNDGLPDGAEVNTYSCDPLLPDSDGDGRNDGDEVALGSDPAAANGVPVSSCFSPAYINGDTVAVSFTNAAEPTALVELYVSWNNSPFIKSDFSARGATGVISYPAQYGEGTYRFYVRATFSPLRVEPPKSEAETTSIVDWTPPATACASPAWAGPDFEVNFASDDPTADVHLWYRYEGGTWTDSTLVQSGNTGEFNFTAASGSGTYEFYTVGSDRAGNAETAPAVPDSATEVDATPPDVSAMDVYLPGPYLILGSTVEISWDEAVDPESSVSYAYAIGTVPGATDVAPYAATGYACAAGLCEVTASVSLPEGETVYATVIASNQGGLAAAPVSSPGSVVDTLPPALLLSEPDGEDVILGDPAGIRLVIRDATSGINPALWPEVRLDSRDVTETTDYTLTEDGNTMEIIFTPAGIAKLLEIVPGNKQGTHHVWVKAGDYAGNEILNRKIVFTIEKPGKIVVTPSVVDLPTNGDPVKFKVTGGISPYTWSWTGGTASAADGDSISYSPGPAPGAFMVSVVDSRGVSFSVPTTLSKLVFKINPQAVGMEPGDTVEFRVQGGTAPYTWFALGGTIMIGTGDTFPYTAGWIYGEYSVAVMDSSTVPDIVSAKITITPDVGRAVIVAGGGILDDNRLVNSINYLGNFAYRTLISRGFTSDKIFYMNPNPTQPFDGNGDGYFNDIDAAPSLELLQYALTGWAAGGDTVLNGETLRAPDPVSEDVPLTVIFLDHGGNNVFLIDRVLTGNTVEPVVLSVPVLDNWLDQIQAAHPCRVQFIYDACFSGTFLDELANGPAGDRIIISSATGQEPAYFTVNGTVSFSQFFFNNIMAGQDLKASFNLAAAAIQNLAEQEPQLDDNGDGVFTEAGPGRDGLQSEGKHIGSVFFSGDETPSLLANPPISDLHLGDTVTVWADVVNYNDLAGIYAVITPPGYLPPQSAADFNSPKLEDDLIPILHLTDPDEDERYTYTISPAQAANIFTTNGDYIVTIFAKDIQDNLSPPATTFISLIGMDIYEQDDDPASANPIVIDDADGQLHNFHQALDEDWVSFTGTAAVPYVAFTENLAPNCDTYMELYFLDGATLTLLDLNDDFFAQDSRIYFTASQTGTYYLMVSHSTGGSGAGTDYLLHLDQDIGAFGSLQGHVTDSVTGFGVYGAQVRLCYTPVNCLPPAATVEGGFYQFVNTVSPGTGYAITVTKANYNNYSGTSPQITAGNVATKEMALNPKTGVTTGVLTGVVSSSGTPVGGVRVTVNFAQVMTDTAGRYQFRLAPASYPVIARADGYSDFDSTVPHPAVTASTTTTFNISLTAAVADTDGDGLTDAQEAAMCTASNDPDSDNDGLCDGNTVVLSICVKGEDLDLNGAVNGIETNPCNDNTDGDGLGDLADCAPLSPNAWNTCATCNDDDADTWFELCNAYSGISGPDCNDADTLINPGRSETTCDGKNNDCNAGTPDDPDEDGDGLSYCNELVWGTSDADSDSDDDGVGDGLEVNTYSTDPADWDSDDDYLPDAFEIANLTGHDPGEDLDPNEAADGAANFDADVMLNAHEYWNGTSLWADSPVPLGGYGIGCYYWGKGDGGNVVQPADIAKIQTAYVGGAVSYAAIIPSIYDPMDLDRDDFPGPGDIVLAQAMYTGMNRPGGYPSTPSSITLVESPSGAVAVGDTAHVTVSVHAQGPGITLFSPGFGVVFQVTTGNAVLLGGEGTAPGEPAGARYDMSMAAATGARARIVVLVTGAGPVSVSIKVPACGTPTLGRWCAEVPLGSPVVINP